METAGRILEGPWRGRRPEFEPGQVVAVMTSGWARSYHWLLIGTDRPALGAANRALCGARPSGHITRWQMADESAVTDPRYERYARQVGPCVRCEARR